MVFETEFNSVALSFNMFIYFCFFFSPEMKFNWVALTVLELTL